MSRCGCIEAQLGKPEYRVGEIFIPVDDPGEHRRRATLRRDGDRGIAGRCRVLGGRRAVQPDPNRAGGRRAWLGAARSARSRRWRAWSSQMPVGAVSNPVKVPGGFDIVTLQGKRQVGSDMGTFISLRQVFLPFTEPLDPQHPTDQQRQALEKARGCQRQHQELRANGAGRENQSLGAAGRSRAKCGSRR